ncbi:zinc-finger domain-containing protein [Mycena amicta]|nr:zinc-finger domain-containing protein [Mycena amicta]
MLRRAILSTVRSLSTAAKLPAEIPTTPLQAANHADTWSASQQPRSAVTSGPRFEQTAMELQPSPLSAMALINDVPVTIVHGRRAVCDGTGGPLGHPKVYINLDLPGARPCGYCGLRFEQAPHHH